MIALITAVAGGVIVQFWAPARFEQIVADHNKNKDLHWLPMQLQATQLRLAEGIARARADGDPAGDVSMRLSLVRARLLDLTSEHYGAALPLYQVDGYRAYLARVEGYLHDADKLLAAGDPTADTYRQLLDGLDQLKPDAAKYSIAGRELENNRRTAEVVALGRQLQYAYMVILLVVGVYAASTFYFSELKGKALSIEQRENQDRNAFLASISHDIRTPLQSILSNVSILKSGLRGHKLHRSAERLHLATHQMQLQIEALINVAELQRGQLSIHQTPICLKTLTNEVVDLLSIEAENKRLDLINDMPELHMLMLDGKRVSQILSNLISNAIRYTDAGFVRLTCHLAPGPTPSLHITVSDSGIGMSREDADRLFEKFARLSNYRAGGSGLGLSIVKGLVTLMNGTITIKSEKGRGTSVYICLPTRLAETLPDAA